VELAEDLAIGHGDWYEMLDKSFAYRWGTLNESEACYIVEGKEARSSR
jgi:hypothetical protein